MAKSPNEPHRRSLQREIRPLRDESIISAIKQYRRQQGKDVSPMFLEELEKEAKRRGLNVD